MIRFLLLTLVLGTFALQPAAARQGGAPDYRDEPVLHEGRAGERIEALIAAFNAGDPAAVRRFLDDHATSSFRDFAPMERHEQAFLGTFRQTGGIDFHSIRTYTPAREEETVVIVRDRTYGGWYGLVLAFDEQDEQRISSIRFNSARPPLEVAAAPLGEAELVAEARALLERGCERDVFSGTALVARGDEVLVEVACGEASKRYHVPNTIETKFNLGSMNKMFTATAVAQLAEGGRLSYDDPISRYVDESWLPREITDRVTVHHLLTHTSGLGSYFNEEFDRTSRAHFREIDDFKPLVQGDTLAFEPGTRFRYSNTGMLLLGVVIESVTGQSYFDYIREHLYAPAGMTRTDSYAMDEPVENLAMGYIPAPERPTGWRNNLFEHVIKGGPAGGGFSTVRDLHRFARALQTGRLVSGETLERLWTSHSEAGYGYGFGVQQGPAGKVVGHGGGFPGLNGQLDLYLDQGYIVAVLSNYDRGAAPVARRIGQLIAQRQV